MGAADSITIDPHKMGFVPYPAGVIAFKNRQVTQFVAQKAQYISDNSDKASFDIDEIRDIGPYILEGSKPGVAAVACWLAAKTIPLNLSNHGKIVKTSILNTLRLKHYLIRHQKHTFFDIETELGGDFLRVTPFKFVPLYDNIDTNLLCFVVVPMKWEIVSKNCSPQPRPKMIFSERWSKLNDLNMFNEDIYKHFTIKDSQQVTNYNTNTQNFFLSRTRIENEQYNYSSIRVSQLSRKSHSQCILNGRFNNSPILLINRRIIKSSSKVFTH